VNIFITWLRVNYNMNLQENIHRIKQMMGLITEDVENNDCYPSDYEPGKIDSIEGKSWIVNRID